MTFAHLPRCRRNRIVCGAACLLGLLSSGCESRPSVEEEKKPQARIALIGRAQNDLAWPVLQLEAARESRRPERLLVEAMAPPTPSPQAQRDMLEQAVARGVNVLCVYPLSPTAIRATIDEIVRRGVPVVLIGRDVPNCARAAYAGPLEVDLGAAAARACGRMNLERSNSIMLLRPDPQSPEYASRYGGFMNGLALLRGIRLLRQVEPPAAEMDAIRIVRTEYRKYPRVAGWVLLDDWPLRLLPAGERLLPAECDVVLASADPVYLESLRAGRLNAMLGFDFRKAVRDGLLAATRLAQADMRGFLSEVSLPVQVITPGEVADWDHLWKAWRQGDERR